MKHLKIFVAALLLFTAGTPAMADNEPDNDNKENYEEIDNYDFIYDNEDYGEDMQFSQIDDMLDEAFATAEECQDPTLSTVPASPATYSRTWA